MSSYGRLASLFRGVFTPNLTVAAQTAGDAERFRAIGADNAQLSVVGNVKFDLELDAGVAAAGRDLREAWNASLPQGGAPRAGS